MTKLTDDEIMAKALLCPESKKVPLEVGDRVIALEDFTFWQGIDNIPKGARGLLLKILPEDSLPLGIEWDYDPGYTWHGIVGPIGKLVKRGSV